VAVGSVGTPTVWVWDARTGELRHQLQAPARGAFQVAFSPDGATLSAAGLDRSVTRWDAVTGELRDTLRGPGAPLCTAAFSTDGKRLVRESADKAMRVWVAGRDGRPARVGS
jgi:WD40 repeat protein